MIPPGAIVVAYTGWAARWKTPEAYRNADAQGILHFPGYSLDAARLLVDSRSAVGLGIDTLSVDFGASRDYEVHRFCASRGVYGLENVANPGQVPQAGAMAVVLPMKLENGSGAPVRIVALLPRPVSRNNLLKCHSERAWRAKLRREAASEPPAEILSEAKELSRRTYGTACYCGW